ncbi:MAG: glutamate-5-semialdehyde dehydrogenase [Vampirovibrionales bacterium]|nr:glutamate-5-semialdehyde dehydrogenase [Vampirovibrionales bacterium]
MAHSDLVVQLQRARHAAQHMASLSTEQKNAALATFAKLLQTHSNALLDANLQDVQKAKTDGLEPALMQRLKLDAAKIRTLIEGVQQVIALDDPAHRVLKTTLLDDDLTLEQRTVPLGVIAIIFESRPDVLPQILTLMLKSGNAVVFKGGREAQHSNRAMMTVIDALNQAHPELPEHWATLIEGRAAVAELLKYPQYVDLVIPRGSNALVQHIMANTQIPVLGHADGVCHLFWHASAAPEKAIALLLDAKTQYPSACNALETVLIDAAVPAEQIKAFLQAALAARVTVRGCAQLRQLSPELAEVKDWHTEYGDLTLAAKMVANTPEAITHINRNGSHHTDGILADPQTAKADIEQFLNTVDSASVFVNASTRFADGFRYGLGAEIGISTSRTHARGPVGLDGLVSTQYRLKGQYHTVDAYTGDTPKAFKHIRV